MAVTKKSDLPEYLQRISEAMVPLGLNRCVITSHESVESLLEVVARDSSLVLEKGLAVFPINEGSEKGNYLVYFPIKE